MINNRLIYSGINGIKIYINERGELLLEQGSYIGDIRIRSSLLRLLPLFELPVGKILEGIIVPIFKIEDLLPFNELILFLINDMKSAYWFGLIGNFLLSDQIKFKFSLEVLKCLKNQEVIYWLPQRETHLLWKLISKNSRP